MTSHNSPSMASGTPRAAASHPGLAPMPNGAHSRAAAPGLSLLPSVARGHYPRVTTPVRRASYARWASAPARWLYPLLVSAGRCFFQYVLAGAVLAVIVWAYLLMVLLAEV